MPGPFGHLLFGTPPFGVDVDPTPPAPPMSGGAPGAGYLVRLSGDRKKEPRLPRATPRAPEALDRDDFEDLLGLLL